MRRFTRVGVFALAVFAAGAALWADGRGSAAQTPATSTAPSTTTAPAASQAAPASRPLMTAVDAEQKAPSPVELESMDFDIELCGPVAETTVTLKFYNHGERMLDGNLEFPIPEGATISGYGLDVGGKMVDGVAVEKYRARQIFESEMRKRVDPGFVEHSHGNTFKTRVYPINPKSSRTVKIKFVQQLAAAVDNDGKVARRVMRYTLPAASMGAMTESTVRISAESAEMPTVNGFAPFNFVQAGNKFSAIKYFRYLPSGDLVINVPENRTQRVLVERRMRSETMDDVLSGKTPRIDEFYFLASADGYDAALKQPARTFEVVSGEAPAIAIYWDASLSREAADKRAELELIEALAKKMNRGRIDVIIFRNEPEAAVSFAIENGDASKVIEKLKATIYDGGTNFSALRFEKSHRLALLFSDGAPSLGELPQKLGIPIVAVASQPGAGEAVLKQIAKSSPAGMCFSLAQTKPAEAVEAIAAHDFTDFWTVEFDSRQVADVYATAATAGDETFTLAGKLLVDEAKLTLKNRRQVHEMVLKRAGAADSTLVSRTWAGRRIEALSAMAAQNAQALREVGREFCMVTPNTSLMVLETADQYWQYKVVPPRSSEKLFAEFTERLKSKIAVEEAQREKWDPVGWVWKSRIRWWETDFSKPAATQPATMPADQERQIALLFRDADTLLQQLQYPEAAATFKYILKLDPDNYAAKAALRLTEDTMMFRTFEKLNQVQGQEFIKQGIIDYELQLPLDVMLGMARDPYSSAFGQQKLEGWDSKTPYLAALNSAEKGKAYDAFLAQRKKFANMPAFYLDCSDWFAKAGDKGTALHIVTDVLELSPDSTIMLRVVAFRMQELGERDLAIDLFEQIKTRRPMDEQTWLDLARAYAARGLERYSRESDRGASAPDFRPALDDLSNSLSAYHNLTTRQWDQLIGIERFALIEGNDLWEKIQKLPGYEKFADSIPSPFDKRFIKNLDCDLRVVLTFDVYSAKIHMQVDEPEGGLGSFVTYTRGGGYMVRGLLRGNCSEEYAVRKALPGKYKFSVKCDESLWQNFSGPAAAHVTVIANFGRADEKRETFNLRLPIGKTEVVCEKEMK